MEVSSMVQMTSIFVNEAVCIYENSKHISLIYLPVRLFVCSDKLNIFYNIMVIHVFLIKCSSKVMDGTFLSTHLVKNLSERKYVKLSSDTKVAEGLMK